MAGGFLAHSESVLKNHVLLSSSDLDEVRSGVAGVLNEHRLTPRARHLDARLYGAVTAGLQMCLLEYGGAVAVETAPSRDFVLVQSALRGEVRVRCREGQWSLRPGDTLIMPSNVSLELEWGTSTTQLLIKIPKALLYEVYEHLTGKPVDDPIDFAREIPLDAAPAHGLRTLIEYFCSHLAPAHGARSGPMGLRIAQQALIGHLLNTQAQGLRDQPAPEVRRVLPRCVRRAQEFMESCVQEVISLQDIASHAGVSVLTLSRAYQDQHGVSPMAALRTMRLNRIRDELKGGRADSVSEVAYRWGYPHLGRFAATYRERFGESPNETLRRRMRGQP